MSTDNNTENPSAPRTCSLPRRLAAMCYDGLLLIGLWMLAAAVVVIALDRSVDAGNPWFKAYLLAVAWPYFAVCWRAGQTLGMKAWHIHIRCLDDSRPGWITSLLRFSVAVASLFCFGLGFLWSLLRRDRATWHDLASGTRLVVIPKTPRKTV